MGFVPVHMRGQITREKGTFSKLGALIGVKIKGGFEFFNFALKIVIITISFLRSLFKKRGLSRGCLTSATSVEGIVYLAK